MSGGESRCSVVVVLIPDGEAESDSVAATRVAAGNDRLLGAAVKNAAALHRDIRNVTLWVIAERMRGRSCLSRLYDALWDLSLDAGCVGLDCRVSMDSLSDNDNSATSAALLPGVSRIVFAVGSGVAYDTFDPRSLPALQAERGLGALEFIEVDGSGEFGSYHLYDNPSDEYPPGDHVLLGGTFDHMHNGHKKLLSVAADSSRRKITVGVTCADMLKSKREADLIESVDARQGRVRSFLTSIAPHLEIDVVVINDPYGPYNMIDLDTIIVSSETLKGARLLNEKRVNEGLKPLRVIAVMRSNAFTLSSTFVRRAIRKEGAAAL